MRCFFACCLAACAPARLFSFSCTSLADASSAKRTGGRRALDQSQFNEHLKVVNETWQPLYADSMRRALQHAQHETVVGAHRRMERNLDNIARAIIAFRAMLMVVVQSGKEITAERKFELGRSLHAFDRNVLVIVGNPTWASGGAARGQQSAPAKTLLEAMAKRWCVFVVHEYNTSQCCADCGAKMVRTRGWSVRHWRCPEAGGTMTKSARNAKAQRHSAEQNKDVTAARFVLLSVSESSVVQSSAPDCVACLCCFCRDALQ